MVNAPYIGAIPDTDLVAMLEHITSKLTAKYNTRLANIVSRLEEHRDMDIIEFDLSKFVTDTMKNAESYGISNSEDACNYVFSQGGVFNPECNLDSFLSFDEIHPATAAYQRAELSLYR